MSADRVWPATGLAAARSKRAQGEMCRHPFLHLKGPGAELSSRGGIWPMWLRTCLPGLPRPCWWTNSRCRKYEHRARAQQPPTPASHGDQATEGAKLNTRWASDRVGSSSGERLTATQDRGKGLDSGISRALALPLICCVTLVKLLISLGLGFLICTKMA